MLRRIRPIGRAGVELGTVLVADAQAVRNLRHGQAVEQRGGALQGGAQVRRIQRYLVERGFVGVARAVELYEEGQASLRGRALRELLPSPGT